MPELPLLRLRARPPSSSSKQRPRASPTDERRRPFSSLLASPSLSLSLPQPLSFLVPVMQRTMLQLRHGQPDGAPCRNLDDPLCWEWRRLPGSSSLTSRGPHADSKQRCRICNPHPHRHVCRLLFPDCFFSIEYRKRLECEDSFDYASFVYFTNSFFFQARSQKISTKRSTTS